MTDRRSLRGMQEEDRDTEVARRAQSDFDLFFNLIPDLACVVSTDGYFKRVNSAWTTTLGYTLEEVLSTPMLEFIHPDDLNRSLAEIAKQSPQHRTRNFENRYRCRDGSYRIFEWTTTFNRDHSTRFGVAKDITEQRLAEESLRESEQRFRIMADSCPTIIWVTDAEGNNQLTNRIHREFFGGTFERAGKEEWRLLLHPDDYTAYTDKFLLAVEQRAPFRAEARVRRADGEWRWIASYAEPRLSIGGEFLGHVGISPDITDRKLTEEALKQAKDAAEAANRAKSEFLANMSHEIRTPMNGVMGLTDLALDTGLTARQRGYLEGVKNSADSLLRILNDILDFAKIEAGKLEFESVEFDLRETVEATLKAFGNRAAAKSLELACDFSPDVPAWATGDPGRLRQILINLIGNAIKFTQRGEVVIRVERSADANAETELHFSVLDTGIGIPADKQKHVFTAFAQADTSSTRRFGGTGLGLSISSQLAGMMGGRIWLESTEGTGSTFHFTVRLGRAYGRLDEAFPIDLGFLNGQHILVVDDNGTSGRIICRMLSARGLTAVLTNSGSAALDALEQARATGKPFTVVVIDAGMPAMDGFTLAQSIKGDPRYDGANIAMLLSGVQSGDAERCRDLGVSAWINKPVGALELLGALCSMSQPVSGTDGQDTRGPDRVNETEGLRRRFLVVEDNVVNRQVARGILEKRNHFVTAVGNGQEALDVLVREDFDCVLMDVQMPVMDGLEATAAIRSKEETHGGHLPIVAMTAHAMAGDLECCLDAGMDGYLTKPIRADDLFATVERVLLALKAQP